MRALKQLSIPTWVFFAFGVPGAWSMMCYTCVWMREGEDHLPSAVNQSDICRPENFKPLVVHKEECQYNCLTMYLYEYVDSDVLSHKKPLEKQVKGKLTTKTSPNNRTRLEETLNSLKNKKEQSLMMTFVYRGCSKDDHFWPQSFCKPVAEKNSSYNYERKCYCPTRFCNGTPTSASTATVNISWKLSVFVALLSIVSAQQST